MSSEIERCSSSPRVRVIALRKSNERNMLEGGVTPSPYIRPSNKWSVTDPSSDFDRVGPLGVGTFGRVFLERHVESGELVATKCVSKANVVHFKQETRVLSERQVLAACNSPFIVKMFATAQDDVSLFFYLEYLPGGELFTRIHTRTRGGLPCAMRTSHVKFYAAEVLCALEAMHKHRFVYRDLKSENIMLDADGHVRLVDMGFAKEIAHKTFSICGTTEYIAPEVAQGRGGGFAADFWALGVLLYEMLTLTTPFRANDKMTMYRRIITEPVRFSADFPSRTGRHLIRKLLNKDPTARLGTGLGGPRNIKLDPFFDEINWDQCAQRLLTPPWAPRLLDVADRYYFVIEGQDFDQQKTPSLSAMGTSVEELMDVFKEFSE